MIQKTSISFGPDSRNRLQEAGDPSAMGAEAALETLYYALNNRDLDALRTDWADSPLVQLNNPVGGILRGADAITGLYSKIFTGPVTVQVTFTEVISYQGREHAVFAGRERLDATDAGPLPSGREAGAVCRWRKERDGSGRRTVRALRGRR